MAPPPPSPGARALLERCGPGRDPQALQAELDQALALGRQAWAGVELSPEDFARHLAERLQPPPSGPLLAGLHLADLYLACACLQGQPRALAHLHAQHLQGLRRMLRRRERTAEQADDAVLQLSEALLLARDGQAPRLAQYQGLTSLRGWLRVVATRALSRMQRRQQAGEAALARQVLREPGSPELEYLKERYRKEVEEVVREALDQLPPRERALLGLYYLDRLTLLEIAELYKVHKATPSRWLDAAREQLAQDTHRRLQARLKLSEGELQSLVRLVISRLDLSIGQHLRGSPPR